MSLIPDWLPNVHPVIVHFPIALLPAAALIDLLSLFWRHCASLRHTATWLYLAGTGFSLLAFFSGHSAVDVMTLSPGVEPFVAEHASWAFRTTWFFACFASLRLAVSYIFPPKPVILLIAFLAAMGGLVMLVETAARGSILVYQHGVGVSGVGANGP